MTLNSRLAPVPNGRAPGWKSACFGFYFPCMSESVTLHMIGPEKKEDSFSSYYTQYGKICRNNQTADIFGS